MKSIFSGIIGGLLGLASVIAPQQAQAAVIGEFNACGTENLSVPVAAAGHTYVSVTTADATSLLPLDTLIYRTCNPYPNNTAINNAVANGMDLIVDATSIQAVNLPGSPALTISSIGACEGNTRLAPGAPITSGPGGTLTDDSFDIGQPGGGNGYCSIMGTSPVATLPAGAIPFVVTPDGAHAGALAYNHGQGQVAVSISQWSYPVVYTPGQHLYPGIKTYFINTLAWALGYNSVTCASEGYTGTKLEWCKNICERGLTGATLGIWIHRWTTRYRDLPYCAVE